MVKRPDDKTPPPPGGRVAERRRMYESARGLTETPGKKDNRSADGKHEGDSGTAATGGSSHADRGKRRD